MKTVCTGALILFFNWFLHAQATLISPGANWKYLDNGTDQGTAWRQTGFVDASWSNGSSELGYGDGDEVTVVSYGPSSSNKYVTTYFRKTISVIDPSAYTYLQLGLVCDDGCVVYVNGYEVYRQDMPSGTISYNTLASSTVAWPFEGDWNSSTFSPLVLNPGNNVIAVEVHQDDVTSSDISFNFELKAFTAPQPVSIVRGPYLQKANQNEVTICWRTDVASDSKISFGTSPGTLSQVVAEPAFVTDHFIKLTGLSESTQYFYQIGTSSLVFSNSNEQSFKTHPPEGDIGLYRFWVVGDAGMGNGDQQAVTDAFLTYNNGKHLDGWLMLGDNAYEYGFDGNYQSGVFNAYPQILPNTVLWPAPGNHDYNNHIPFSPAPAYYNIFDLPVNGEAGGVPSGTEKYYSWNFGNIHFISLDSYDEGRATTDPMAVWLESDLAANALPWVVVYWHHPPYTKGSHDSDDWLLNGELIDMRENILPILESYGVDLVLNGHSHSYERSSLLDGHYGYSTTFDPAVHLKDPGSGDYINDCPYIKTTDNGNGHLGAVFAVVGCSGKLSSTSSDWPHPVMYSYTAGMMGSLLIEVNDGRMDCKFITSVGTIYDQFSIVKDPGGISNVAVCQGEQVTLTPSWSGNASWEPFGIWSDAYTFNAIIPSVVYAEDSLGCIRDTFNITLLSAQECGLGIENNISQNDFVIIDNSIQKGSSLQLRIPEEYAGALLNATVYSPEGKIIREYSLEVSQSVLFLPISDQISDGMHILQITQPASAEKIATIKFIVY